ncbi:MAG: archease [Thermoproteota archaeon]|jgi:Uncharacterized conserved protein
MSEGYRYLDDVSIADLAFEAKAEKLEDLFRYSAIAVSKAMILNLEEMEEKVEKNVELESESLEMLLFNFLQELIFYKDSELLVFKRFELKIEMRDKYYLRAKMYGEKIDPNKHKFGIDVKAVTMHLFELKREKNFWLAKVVLDV